MPSYVITGASRGLGLEFARQLSLDQKNTVFGLVRSKATAEKLAALGKSNIHILEADVTDRKRLQAAAHEVAKVTDGKLDFLINNAAFIDDKRNTLALDDYEDGDQLEEDLVYNFSINVVGVVNTINAFLPLIRKGHAKKIITISTGAADVDSTLKMGFPGHAPYAISKAAVNMVVAKYATKFKAEGLVFLALSPGYVDTAVRPLTDKQIEESKALTAFLQTIAPHFKGPLSSEESVKLQLDVINKWAVEESGAFVSHLGTKQWL